MTSFNNLVVSHWDEFSTATSEGNTVVVDGTSLRLADIVAVARHGLCAELSPHAVGGIERSAAAIQKSIADGEIIYGVNTGFGGSADTRTQKIENLQREIMRGLNYGVLDGEFYSTPSSLAKGTTKTTDAKILPLDNQTSNQMPEAWVRGTMLIRLNSLSSGASGVRLATVQTLFKLLQENIIPLTPLRGSISASGDLSPLSYIGGTMQGKPNLLVWAGPQSDRRVIRADCALAEKSIPKVRLGPKEGLAIVNGTAASTSVGALAMHEALCQAALSQVLTSMSVEALLGTDESFDPFFSDVRPHPGQRDAASAILEFLNGSSLMQRGDGSEKSSLRQDRYSLRTAPQWIGPVFEDFVLAHQQITDELNSVTDNPLIDCTDSKQHRTIHGGNFQARSITSAMEKLRQGIQGIGRMLFTQCTELINPTTNRGLPPNLVFDEPSESYIWKGTDVMIASLTSELGFLANPVGTHVQTAEMGNQALNSLALISARYTLEALSILTQLSSAHLVALCQALDLRAMNCRFFETLEPLFHQLFASTFTTDSFLPPDSDAKRLADFSLSLKCWGIFTQRLAQLSTQNSRDRFTTSISATSSYLLPLLTSTSLPALQIWSLEATSLSLKLFHANKDIYYASPDATPFLGAASKRMYTFVRQELGIPFIRNDSISTPKGEMVDGEEEYGFGGGEKKRQGMTIGDVITEVYRAQRSGALYSVVVECLKEAGVSGSGIELQKEEVKEAGIVIEGRQLGGMKRAFVEDEGSVTDDSGIERDWREKRRRTSRA
ncbi:phenylalanine ammonia-lyase [Melanomma pulvis-pyrius CBS 109.77]|uniref:Phenylalanine ammonia-lyase n=1 Tax=Melanomma pulvis-pyrius CBS 109.77 TaxID=1314802 RepID=A0A6A6X543_9PLEO|nr:phenylalanine ammonia-lyase [Melanomma pulvis-pyrius CBS 109.77]